jgi:polyketide biosynthesis enoyl-CoA hydratase PksH
MTGANDTGTAAQSQSSNGTAHDRWLLVRHAPNSLHITLNRPEANNALNSALLQELNHALDEAEATPGCCAIILSGQSGTFCSGMDLHEVISSPTQAITQTDSDAQHDFMSTLKRLSQINRITLAYIDGKVTAGGVGLAAACDLVIATPRSQFTLSEALWGLIPACVSPFLIRRVGYHQAYRMALTTETLSAEQAHSKGLVDDLTEQPQETLRRHLLRLRRLQPDTIAQTKAFFQKMWFVNEATEQHAVSTINQLVQEPHIQENIRNFLEHGNFPWEKQR